MSEDKCKFYKIFTSPNQRLSSYGGITGNNH